MSRRVAELLEAASGAQDHHHQDDDSFPSLEDRVAMANSAAWG
jgi:N-acetylmuramoyl-L-alanine amidase